MLSGPPRLRRVSPARPTPRRVCQQLGIGLAWEYTIGGYQVMKKWLSYREEKLLGRPLTKDEVRYVQEMARRIAALLLLEPALDSNYQNVKAHTFPWKG